MDVIFTIRAIDPRNSANVAQAARKIKPQLMRHAEMHEIRILEIITSRNDDDTEHYL